MQLEDPLPIFDLNKITPENRKIEKRNEFNHYFGRN